MKKNELETPKLVFASGELETLKLAFALGVVNGYNGFIDGNPYVTESNRAAYEEGYDIGYGYLEDENWMDEDVGASK